MTSMTPTRQRRRSRLTRPQRLCRRVILPFIVALLVGGLVLTGTTRFGDSHSGPQQPLNWTNDTAYLVGGSSPDPYTKCLVLPRDGERRWITVPGAAGARVEAWFDGPASITCGRSVLVATGWRSQVYPLASNGTFMVILTSTAILAWWYARPRAVMNS